MNNKTSKQTKPALTSLQKVAEERVKIHSYILFNLSIAPLCPLLSLWVPNVC